MKVYFSGISGTGIGPLAELVADAGYEVCGSDMQRGLIAKEIDLRNIDAYYGEQDGNFLRKKHQEKPIDWFVYSSAIPQDHPELKLAKELGIHCSKRDEFLNDFLAKSKLKLLAIAGTHGKTTTTSLLIWAFHKLNIPVSYLVGTTLSWAPGAHYDKDSSFFIYEADEYDRNFLAFSPYYAMISCIDYDHPDIYPTIADYQSAFAQFESQSEHIIKNIATDARFSLIGEHRRESASIVLRLLQSLRKNGEIPEIDDEDIIAVLNDFPGAGRRFEKICDNVYSDYGHHPKEICETLKMAQELKEQQGFTDIAVVYEPHQNSRQYKLKDDYRQAFLAAGKIFWLPTFLVREDPSIKVLKPEEIYEGLENVESVKSAELNEELYEELCTLKRQNWLIILFTAGPADSWWRKHFLEK